MHEGNDHTEKGEEREVKADEFQIFLRDRSANRGHQIKGSH